MPTPRARLSSVRLLIDTLDRSPSEVTNILGISPSSTCSCGFSSYVSTTSWVLEQPGPLQRTIPEQVEALVQLLEPHRERVHQVARSFPTCIAVCVDDRDWISEYDPAGYRSGEFEIPPRILMAVSDLQLPMRFSFTCGVPGKANPDTCYGSF